MFASATSVSALAQTQANTFEPTTFEVDGVGKVDAELGRFSVREDRTKAQGRLAPRSAACAAELRATGIDLSAHTTDASADDLEDLRIALGVVLGDFLAR